MEMRSAAEPLQSLSSQQNSKHKSLNINNNEGNKKKKKRRRRRRRTTPKMERVSSNLRNNVNDNTVAFGRPTTSGDRSSWTLPCGPPTPVLRPVGAQVPRAPENSTQFIMDDHENSTLFTNFDNFSTPHWEQEPPNSGGEDDPIIGTPSGTPTHPLNRDWFPFNLADFETAYQSAREDKLMAGSTDDLKAAIVALEARAAVLTDALSASPSRLLSTLQSQLLQLQEDNAALRLRLSRRQQREEEALELMSQPPQSTSSSSSSTDSDSESDSTNSSSDCSESDCDTCAARRRQTPVSDDEKENTRPSQCITASPALDANITVS